MTTFLRRFVPSATVRSFQRRNGQLIVLTMAIWCTALACNDLSGLAGKQTLPAGISDPNSYNTRAGALALYQGVLYAFQARGADTVTTVGNATLGADNGMFVNFALTSGLLTDELQAGNLGGVQTSYLVTNYNDLLDARQLPEGVGQSVTDPTYTLVNSIRNAANQAIGALAVYDSVDSPALRGHLYALQGYSIIFLADLYCSGVPLSTLDFHGDFTYHAGSTTPQLYQAAIAKFDTAIALSRDSARILNLARIGKGRAELALGQYDSAAAAVDSVPMGFAYQFLVDWSLKASAGGTFALFGVTGGVTVSDSEGGIGVPYRSSGDPRTASASWSSNSFHDPQYIPLKYGGVVPGITAVTVADWIEARLIQGEVALQHGDVSTWLNTLNALRTDGTTTPVPPDTMKDTLGVTFCSPTLICGASPGGSDPAMGQPNGWIPPTGYSLAAVQTVYPAPAGIQSYCNNSSWYEPCYGGDSMVVNLYVSPAHARYNAGTGGVAGLAPLSDPGTTEARVALMFRERAYRLYLTGHRQGDLRRYIRNYGLDLDAVYPTGAYPLFGSLSLYGEDITAPIPTGEHANPLFTGCFSRGA